MAVRKKAIFKKAVSRKLTEKKYGNAKRRLNDAFKGISKRPGRIDLDPREWNGGFNQPPAQQLQPRPGMIDLDPREWNGGFNEPPAQQHVEDFYKKAERNKMQALLQQRQFQKPQPGPSDEMISQGFNNAMNQGRNLFDRELQNQYVPGEVRGQGQEVGMIQQRPHEMYQSQLRPTEPRRGGIQLDPREWGGGGGFNQMPKFPNPPMKQQPAQMPGVKSLMPNPGLGGGMPLQGPKQMPMPNPRRGLIPRPIDPRYKLM